MNRFGRPEELVGAAVFLASDAASGFVTGTDIRVDGVFWRRRSKVRQEATLYSEEKTSQFAICLNNEGYEASLEVGGG